MIVMCPIGNRHASHSCCEDPGMSEKRHESIESTVGAAVKSDALAVDIMIVHQIFRRCHGAVHILPTHMAVDSCAAIPTIACTSSIINAENHISLLSHVMMEKSRIGPAFVNCLGVACSVDVENSRSLSLGRFWQIEVAVNEITICVRESDELGFGKAMRLELRGGGISQRLNLCSRAIGHHAEFSRCVTVAVA